MPSLIDIRRRIRSVKNTQQITKAMKMVSTAKLRRAQERVVASRPYAAMLQQMLANVSAAAQEDEEIAASPLLNARPENRIQVVLMTSDRGLAGAFNSNLIKATLRFIEEHPGAQIDIETLGRKGRDFFKRRTWTVTGEQLGIFNKPAYADAHGIAQKLVQRILNDEIDSVYVIYNEFKSILSQKLTINKILPIIPNKGEMADYIFDQPPKEILKALLPRYVDVQIYQGLVETAASEHAARMTAMDAASSNAEDVIDKLTLNLNRVRQASITREIIEVVSGAAALD